MMKVYKILKYIIFAFPIVLFVYAILISSRLLRTSQSLQPIEIIRDMAHQNISQKQSKSNYFADSISTRIVPEDAFPSSDLKYPYNMLEFMRADSQNVNPIFRTDYTISRGENLWMTHCASCHGKNGDGDGTVITQVELSEDEEGFPAPPNLKRSETIALSDGRLFHILSAGQNLMFPISYKIKSIDRWILVNYIRELQTKTEIKDNEITK